MISISFFKGATFLGSGQGRNPAREVCHKLLLFAVYNE